MTKFLLALALMMVLSVLASAENDSVTTGTYKISFDIGMSKSSYNVTAVAPKTMESLSGEKSTYYEIVIQNETDFEHQLAIIGLTHYEKEQPIATPDKLQTNLKEVIDKYHGFNVGIVPRIIDGVSGAAGSYDMIY